jgi:hypothetical protein
MYALVEHTYLDPYAYGINQPQQSRVLATTLHRQAALRLFVDQREDFLGRKRFHFGGCSLEDMYFAYWEGIIHKITLRPFT